MLYGLEQDPDFQHLRTKLLVSCPAGGPDPGGLFLLDFEHNRMQKLYEGTCSGVVRIGKRWLAATDDNQLIAFDDEFRVIRRTKHGKLDFHGAAKLNDGVALIAETAANAIGCYAADTFERIGEIRFSASDKDVHHINDLWLDGDTLYVSMFSPYDKWFLDPVGRNGAIVAVDLTGFRPEDRMVADPAAHVVVGGLCMPHTVLVHRGRLSYCDSMSFRVVVGGRPPIQTSGFTRGLAITEDAIFIGQSRMRHVLRIPHEFSNCSLDGGIYVYNPELRISRFVPLPAQQVYQIVVLDSELSAGGMGDVARQRSGG